LAYNVAPSTGVGVGVGVGVGAGADAGVVVAERAVTIAWISVALRVERDPMPPTLPLMAACTRAMVVPRLPEVAN